MEVKSSSSNNNSTKEVATTTTRNSITTRLPDGRIIVRIHNEIYDLTNFVERHPIPTDVFTPLAGKDATLDFLAAHDVESKPWKVLNAYKYRGPNRHCSLTRDEIDAIIPQLQPEDQDVLNLYHKFQKEGLYDWTWRDYLVEEISGVLLLLIGFYVVMFGAQQRDSPVYWFGFVLATIGMGRCQLHVHNLMHSDRSHEYQRWYGLVTSGWDMYTGLTYHRVHHVFTNITELDGAVESAPFLWHESQVRSNKDDAKRFPLWLRGILCPLVYYFGFWTISQPIGISGLMPSWFKLYLDQDLVAPERRPGVLVGLFCIARTYFLCSQMGIWHYWLIHTLALAVSFGTTTGQHFDDDVVDVKDVHSVMHDQSF